MFLDDNGTGGTFSSTLSSKLLLDFSDSNYLLILISYRLWVYFML